MKRNFLKAVSVIMVLVLSFTLVGLLNASAVDNEPDFPCGGVIEEVDVKILFSPPTSRVVIGRFGPVLTGTVLKVTYPDGESEILTVKKNGGEYYAGDYSVHLFNFGFEPIISDYGIENKALYLSREIENFVGYSGEADFIYLNLPSVADIVFLISSYFRIWF